VTTEVSILDTLSGFLNYSITDRKLANPIFQLKFFLFVDLHLCRFGKCLVRSKRAQCSPHVDIDDRQADNIACVDPAKPSDIC
jgi:hypothetical protein